MSDELITSESGELNTFVNRNQHQFPIRGQRCSLNVWLMELRMLSIGYTQAHLPMTKVMMRRVVVVVVVITNWKEIISMFIDLPPSVHYHCSPCQHALQIIIGFIRLPPTHSHKTYDGRCFQNVTVSPLRIFFCPFRFTDPIERLTSAHRLEQFPGSRSLHWNMMTINSNKCSVIDWP